MPPRVALIVFVAGIAGLFALDRDRESRASPALWIPVIWMAIGASRMLSEWFQVGVTASPDQYLEGSPLDRLIATGLLAGGLMILAVRAGKAGALVRANIPILLFFLYCLVSVVWSDFPAVAFKRWTKALGNVAMVLIVLTDPEPDKAARRLLSWAGFLLIPASVLVIKYYPEVGRAYDRWVGTAVYVGVTEGKNSLGSNCLVFGLGSLWCCIDTYRNAKPPTRRRKLIAHGTILAMVMWLLLIVNSSTSMACFMLGAGLITMLTLFGTSHPRLVHFALGSMAFTALFSFFFLDAYTYVVESLGRDASLTGRTDLWAEVLRITPHPLFGAGFESFFLGDRLEYLWRRYWWHPNEAHNGYIEIYLSLGWIGISLLAMLLVTGYRNISRAIRSGSDVASLKLALFIVAIVYNLTEAAFKVMHPVWITFLLAAVALPKAALQVQKKDERKVTVERRPLAFSVPPMRRTQPLNW